MDATIWAKGIRIEEFMNARSREIVAMSRNISQNNGVRRVFQTLPRDMRRRAMSHNAKRLPIKYRQIAMNELEEPTQVPKKSKCRKNRRSRRHIGKEFGNREGKNKWLETHLHHAKRMKMISKWGYWLAEYPSGKSFKACYRASLNSCLLHDASYLRCVQLQGSLESCLSLLRLYLNECDFQRVKSEHFLSGIREGTFTLRHRLSSQVYGPSKYLWRPAKSGSEGASERCCWLWLHPSFSESIVKDLLDTCPESSLSISTVDLNRIELRGPQSLSHLQNIFHVSDDPIFGNISPQTWKMFVSDPSQHFQNHTITCISVFDPRLNFPVKSLKSPHEFPPPLLPSPPSDPQPICDKNSSSLWDAQVRKGCLLGKISEKDLNARRSALIVPGALSPSQADTKIPVMIISEGGVSASSRFGGPALGYAQGFDLVLPRGWAVEVFRALVFSGCRVGGLREKHCVAKESGSLYFPDDFPETEAYQAESLALAQQQKDSFLRKPPSKRPNYGVYGVSFPFHAPWGLLASQKACVPLETHDGLVAIQVVRDQQILCQLKDSLLRHRNHPRVDSCHQFVMNYGSQNKDVFVPIHLVMVSRGVPERNSFLCLPLKEDLDTLPNGKSCLKSLQEPLHRAEDFVVSLTSQQFESKRNLQNLRSIVGFCTSAGYSYSHARGTAIGYIALGSLVELCQLSESQESPSLYIRNSTSAQYRSAFVDVIVH
eukprot:Sdes_comp19642_c0_seq1m11429